MLISKLNTGINVNLNGGGKKKMKDEKDKNDESSVWSIYDQSIEMIDTKQSVQSLEKKNSKCGPSGFDLPWQLLAGFVITQMQSRLYYSRQ